MSVDYKLPILIVDDYKTMRRIIRNLLKRLGFENCDEAPNGDAALNKMREKKYGLVISDWDIEPVTGLELLEHVRGDGNMKDIRFILMTAESVTDNIIAAQEVGKSNYIVKPFNVAKLKQKLTTVLGEF